MRRNEVTDITFMTKIDMQAVIQICRRNYHQSLEVLVSRE